MGNTSCCSSKQTVAAVVDPAARPRAAAAPAGGVLLEEPAGKAQEAAVTPCEEPISGTAIKGLSEEVWRRRVAKPQSEGDDAQVQVKALTYNLCWWDLYGERQGNNGSASSLVAAAMPGIMGCQECNDISRVLREGGLESTYTAIQGPHSLAIAYKTCEWELVAQGWKEIAVDEPEQFYGSRSVQWARLRHRQSNKVLFFVNHHGPLRVNSGGRKGGPETAYNILIAIHENVELGDSVILLGDFNAQMGSQTVRHLEQYIPRAASGTARGGVDHFFSELSMVGDLENLGTGGSDHDALAATFAF
mmetsp:Transcript_55946/g.141653  ORF Transcript_55946/g.141653 Transcript_55946/m.141653 type:complete len:304 (+) Transcript_55946:93-1004(+)